MFVMNNLEKDGRGTMGKGEKGTMEKGGRGLDIKMSCYRFRYRYRVKRGVGIQKKM